MFLIDKIFESIPKGLSKNTFFIFKILFNNFRNHHWLAFHNFYVNNFNSIAFYKAFQFLKSNNIFGDIYEFGVFRGETAILLAKLMSYHHFSKFFSANSLYLFDSFEGFPEISKIDEHDGKWKKGMFKTSKNMEANIYGKVSKLIGSERTNIVKGWYDETTKESKGNKKIALLHIDCDLYESTKIVLENIGDLLKDGTVMLCDDYWHFRGRKDKGEQLALRQFFENSDAFTLTNWFQYGWCGQALIVNRKIVDE